MVAGGDDCCDPGDSLPGGFPSRTSTATTAAATSTRPLAAASTTRRRLPEPAGRSVDSVNELDATGWGSSDAWPGRYAAVDRDDWLGSGGWVGSDGCWGPGDRFGWGEPDGGCDSRGADSSGVSRGSGWVARVSYGSGSGGSWSKTSIGSPSSVSAGSFNGFASTGASAASASLAERVRSAGSGCMRFSTTRQTMSASTTAAAAGGRLGGGPVAGGSSPVRSCQPVTPTAYRSWLMDGGSPASASGATYPGVPTIAPCWVRRGSPSDNAMPKSLRRSTGLPVPVASSSKFAGLTSR